MNDTSPAVEKTFRMMLLRRSGAERLKMGCSMLATSRALVKASISKKYPRVSAAKLKQELFLRFYGDQFEPKEQRKILLALRKAAEHKGKRDTIVKSSASGAVREKGGTYGGKRKGKSKRPRP